MYPILCLSHSVCTISVNVCQIDYHDDKKTNCLIECKNKLMSPIALVYTTVIHFYIDINEHISIYI